MPRPIEARGPDTWLLRVYQGIDPATRKKRYFNETFYGNRRAAKTRLDQLRHAQQQQELPTEKTRLPLITYLREWASTRPKLRANTREHYREFIERYVSTAALALRPLREITDRDLEALYAELHRTRQPRPLAASTIRFLHSILSGAFRAAKKKRIIGTSPCDTVDLEHVAHREMATLTPDELPGFLKAAEREPYGLVFEFALMTGM